MVKKRIVLVYNNFGIGGITKSIIESLRVIDYSKYDVTLYIRRNDVIELINEVPDTVNIITVENEVKKRIFENNLKGRIAKLIYVHLNKKHKYLAKQFFTKYKFPIQRKKEALMLSQNNLSWDIAISYSTDGDDPIFVIKNIKADKKYVFIHQSTKIDPANIKIMKKFDGIVSVNPALLPWISSMTKSTDKIFTIENFVNAKNIKQMSKEFVCTPQTNNLVLATCGRLCPTKGFDYVVKTADILRKNGFEFLWYWVGDGPSRSEMETMIKQHCLENEIIITGFLNNPYPYVDCCDIYIQPSRAEAYPLAIIEAFALEKIIISSKTKGGKYLINKYNCGFLVDESPDKIASQIISIANNSNLKNSEKAKVMSINWENEKIRYTNDWEALLSGNLDVLKS